MKQQYFPPSPYHRICSDEFVSIEFDSCEIRDDDINITLLCHAFDDYEYRVNATRLVVDNWVLDNPDDAFYGDNIDWAQDEIDIFIKKIYILNEQQIQLKFDIEIERRPVPDESDEDAYWDEDSGFERVDIIKNCKLPLVLKTFLINPDEVFDDIFIHSDQSRFLINAFNQLVQNYQDNRKAILDLVAKTAGSNIRLARDMWCSLMEEFPAVLHSTLYEDFTGELMLLISQKHGRELLFRLLDDFGCKSDFFIYFDSIITKVFGDGGRLDLWPSIYIGHLIETNDALKLGAVLLAVRRNKNKRESFFAILDVAIFRGVRKSVIKKTPLSQEMKTLLMAQETYIENQDEKIKYKLLLLDIM